MNDIKSRARELNVAYIGGGSRGWAWGFMMDLAMDADMCGTVRLYDIDRSAAQRNEIIGNKISAHPDAASRWHYEVSVTLQDALIGADFIVISILPGTFAEMRSDVHLPERLGIYQPVGDTVGSGGFMRAMRTIPMYVEIGEAIKAWAPEAWVINYTNPMSLCVRTLYHVFPQIKAFGCCHEVFGTQKVLAAAAAELLCVPVPERRDIHVNVFGINHFTWFDEASWKGVDLFPLWKEFADRHYAEGFDEPDRNWANSSFDCAHRVKFDLFRRYGCIAAAGDRHLAEFMPGDEYLKDPETVKSWKFGLTTVQWRKDDLQDRLRKSREIVAGVLEPDREPSGEEGILLMKALTGMDRVISNVNLPNAGQIPNLQRGLREGQCPPGDGRRPSGGDPEAGAAPHGESLPDSEGGGDLRPGPAARGLPERPEYRREVHRRCSAPKAYRRHDRGHRGIPARGLAVIKRDQTSVWSL